MTQASKDFFKNSISLTNEYEPFMLKIVCHLGMPSLVVSTTPFPLSRTPLFICINFSSSNCWQNSVPPLPKCSSTSLQFLYQFVLIRAQDITLSLLFDNIPKLVSFIPSTIISKLPLPFYYLPLLKMIIAPWEALRRSSSTQSNLLHEFAIFKLDNKIYSHPTPQHIQSF